MASEMNSSKGNYWLVYYQPVPETGERIAVGLILQDQGRRPQVKFDTKFSKILRVFPTTDPATLAFYFQNIAEQLELGGPIESTLNAFGPQLVPSKARSVVSPISAEVVDHLIARHLLPVKKLRGKRDQPDGVANEIESFVRGSVTGNFEFRKNVRAQDILGRSVAGTKRIAMAVQLDGKWALIDGVDLNQSTPKQTTDRADEIARTYWNYRRAAAGNEMPVKSIGIVLNGNSHLEPKTLEAHDYALHRFQADSDFAIDAAHPGSTVALGNLLQSLIQH